MKKWAAQCAPKLVLPHLRSTASLCFKERVIGVQDIVAQKLPQGAMQMIGTGFGYDFDIRP